MYAYVRIDKVLERVKRSMDSGGHGREIVPIHAARQFVSQHKSTELAGFHQRLDMRQRLAQPSLYSNSQSVEKQWKTM